VQWYFRKSQKVHPNCCEVNVTVLQHCSSSVKPSLSRSWAARLVKKTAPINVSGSSSSYLQKPAVEPNPGPDETSPHSLTPFLKMFESESDITTDGQSASLSWNKAHIWGLRPNFYYYQTVVVYVGRSLWRENESVVYNCYWSSPAQSFSGPTTVGLVTIFYCLRFETSLFASYDSQGYGGGIRPRLHRLLPYNP
jgi:hypothetical protein